MATDAQIQANRNNATRSTGPRSEAGKVTSTQNSLKHGGYATSSIAIPEDISPRTPTRSLRSSVGSSPP